MWPLAWHSDSQCSPRDLLVLICPDCLPPWKVSLSRGSGNLHQRLSSFGAISICVWGGSGLMALRLPIAMVVQAMETYRQSLIAGCWEKFFAFQEAFQNYLERASIGPPQRHKSLLQSYHTRIQTLLRGHLVERITNRGLGSMPIRKIAIT